MHSNNYLCVSWGNWRKNEIKNNKVARVDLGNIEGSQGLSPVCVELAALFCYAIHWLDFVGVVKAEFLFT